MRKGGSFWCLVLTGREGEALRGDPQGFPVAVGVFFSNAWVIVISVVLLGFFFSSFKFVPRRSFGIERGFWGFAERFHLFMGFQLGGFG